MVEPAIDFSIVIPAYNEEALLPKTLERLQSILAELPQHGEVVVTDNNSTDRTAAIAEAGGARVVFEPHQQIARSRNTGGHAARGRHLIFVDADTLVSRELIAASLAALEGATVCGGGTMAAFDTDAGSRLVRISVHLWNRLSRRFRWACGAYVYCRRDAFEDVKGFDERFYASEEIHFSRALKKWGKARSMEVRILDIPICTSSRKMEWFGIWGMLWHLIPLVCCPFLLNSRWGCRQLWYSRPGDAKKPPPDGD